MFDWEFNAGATETDYVSVSGGAEVWTPLDLEDSPEEFDTEFYTDAEATYGAATETDHIDWTLAY